LATQNKLEWEEIRTEIETVDWKGNPIHLKNVPAIKNTKTGTVAVYPEALSLAEMSELAKKYKLEPRDMALLLMVYAKPGHFQAGIMPHKYRLNKSLFYLWKELGKEGLGEAFPHDNFVKFPAGPVPEHIDPDLDRLEKNGLVKVSLKPWGKGEGEKSRTTELLPEGMKLAEQLWQDIPDPFKQEILTVKEKIFPLDPKTIMNQVHREYPEYKLTYTKPDTE
jgi:DNA-binding PadR family transcriptional regulator